MYNTPTLSGEAEGAGTGLSSTNSIFICVIQMQSLYASHTAQGFKIYILLRCTPENPAIPYAIRSGDSFIFRNERIAGANSVGDDRIFRNGMTENEQTK